MAVNHTAKQIVPFRAKNYRQLPTICERVFTINNNCIDQGSLKRNWPNWQNWHADFCCVSFFSGQSSREHKTPIILAHEIASTGHCSCVRSAGRGTHRRLKEPCQNHIPAQRTKHGRRNPAWNRTPLRLMVVFLHDQIDHFDQVRANLVNLVNLVTWNFWESCNANAIALFALWIHESAESTNVYDEQQKPVGMKKKKVGIRSAWRRSYQAKYLFLIWQSTHFKIGGLKIATKIIRINDLCKFLHETVETIETLCA